MTLIFLALLSATLVRAMIRLGALDHPVARSSHTQPTPKGGGVGIVAAFITGLLVLHATAPHPSIPNLAFLGLISTAILIAAISYTDDLRDFPFHIKLAAQFAASLVAIACGIRFQTLHIPWIGALPTGWLGIPLTAAWIVFATNAVNFIDGLNGLASGSTAIACIFLAAIAHTQHDWFVQTACLVLAAGIAGFLPFNYPRARIFMGDVGSQFCGFVLAVLGVLASRYGSETLSVLLVPMMLFGILFDVVFTLIRRALAGQNITQAHRGHLYQVAQRAGLPAWAVAIVYWGMAACGGVICIGFTAASGPLKPIIPLCVLIPQIAWLVVVHHLARRAAIKNW